MVDFLLQRGEHLNNVDHEGTSALIIAISRADDGNNCHSYLLDRGARANFATSNGFTTLHAWALCCPYRQDIATMLLQHGANPMAKRLPPEEERLAGEIDGITVLRDVEKSMQDSSIWNDEEREEVCNLLTGGHLEREPVV